MSKKNLTKDLKQAAAIKRLAAWIRDNDLRNASTQREAIRAMRDISMCYKAIDELAAKHIR